MEVDRRFKLFLVLTAVFVTCLLVGDLIGGKLIQTTLGGQRFTLTVGMIPFPVTFLLTDLLNEFYGQKATRFVTWVGLAMAVLAYGLIFVAAEVPIADLTRTGDWAGVTDDAFNRVFVGSRRMIVASLTAYVIAQLVDISVFHLLKRLTKDRLLWLRATGSTAISQGIDTVAITLVAWVGLLPFATMVEMMVSAYVLKLAIAIGLTPLIYAGHAVVERLFGLEPVAATPTRDVDDLAGERVEADSQSD